jgi:hypothetical protein
MDDESPDVTTDVIRKQMEETRSQISEKLEILETQLTDTVQSTTTAVNETVGAVKDTVESVTNSVQEGMQSVGEVFDLRLQADRNPWVVFGGSVAVGFVAGRYLFDRRRPAPHTALPAGLAAQAAAAPARPGWISGQLRQLRGIAVGALMDIVRDVISKGLPRPTVQPPAAANPSGAPAFRANVAPPMSASMPASSSMPRPPSGVRNSL